MRPGARLVGAAAVILAMLAISASARADDPYPSRPIHILVGFPPDSVAGVVLRLIGQTAGEDLGQPLAIEDRPGGSGNLAAEIVARAPKDGYTLLMATIANTINAGADRNPPFNFERDLAPISMVASEATVLAINASLPARSVKELIALAKEKPGQILLASSGNGRFTHLLGELFGMRAGVKLTLVSYESSAEVLADLVAGGVMAAFIPASAVLSERDSGAVRLLATSGRKRAAALPDLPTMAEAGIVGFDATLWMGVLAPAGTPAPIIGRLAKAFAKGLAHPDVRAKFTEQGIDVVGFGPAEFATYVHQDTDKWTKVVRSIGLKIE